MAVLTAVAMCVALVAAARSTWSPCGLSMLSTITPLGENARGHRYPVTVTWFLLGAVAGGATLGVVLAAGAAVLALADPTSTALLVVSALACFVVLASDLRVRGFALPAHRRQVDEVWLMGFRPWVYGVGFGWQIGVGLATFITTGAVYLTCVLAVLTVSPAAAFAVGVLFGAVRGLAVLLGVRATTVEALRSLHARLERLDPVAARITQLGVATAGVALCAALSQLAAAVGTVVVVVLLIVAVVPKAARHGHRVAGPAGSG